MLVSLEGGYIIHWGRDEDLLSLERIDKEKNTQAELLNHLVLALRHYSEPGT